MWWITIKFWRIKPYGISAKKKNYKVIKSDNLLPICQVLKKAYNNINKGFFFRSKFLSIIDCVISMNSWTYKSLWYDKTVSIKIHEKNELKKTSERLSYWALTFIIK